MKKKTGPVQGPLRPVTMADVLAAMKRRAPKLYAKMIAKLDDPAEEYFGGKLRR